VLSFRHTKHPVLTAAPDVKDASSYESMGETALLQVGASVPQAMVPAAANYSVLDLSAPAGPAALASVDNVAQRLVRPETGTLFLLNPDGLTVIRRTRVEEEYRGIQVQMDHN
jgi:hypothetical protein